MPFHVKKTEEVPSTVVNWFYVFLNDMQWLNGRRKIKQNSDWNSKNKITHWFNQKKPLLEVAFSLKYSESSDIPQSETICSKCSLKTIRPVWLYYLLTHTFSSESTSAEIFSLSITIPVKFLVIARVSDKWSLLIISIIFTCLPMQSHKYAKFASYSVTLNQKKYCCNQSCGVNFKTV